MTKKTKPTEEDKMQATKAKKAPELPEFKDELPKPDTSWLTNPGGGEDDGPTEEEIIKAQDELYLSKLKDNARRGQALTARLKLKQEGAITPLQAGSMIDKGGFSLKGVSINHPQDELKYTGDLALAWELNTKQINTKSLVQYLQALDGFEGTGNELVSQIAHDLFILLRPLAVKVTYTLNVYGAKVKAQAEHKVIVEK